MKVLGIDVGGSGIKGALVDVTTGQIVSEHIRLRTPRSFKRKSIAKTIATLVRKFDYEGMVGIGFPAAVASGVVLTPPTAHKFPDWLGHSLNDLFSETTGCQVAALNDADAAGLAEIRFGAGRGVNGVVLTLTLGTGVGGGLFMDGKLVPNLEIGMIYLKDHPEVVEQYVASRVKKELNLDWQEYGERLNEFCLHVEHVFSPQLIIIGGGVSRKHSKFMHENQLQRTRIVPAQLRNQAGIVGAAIWASESGAPGA